MTSFIGVFLPTAIGTCFEQESAPRSCVLTGQSGRSSWRCTFQVQITKCPNGAKIGLQTAFKQLLAEPPPLLFCCPVSQRHFPAGRARAVWLWELLTPQGVEAMLHRLWKYQACSQDVAGLRSMKSPGEERRDGWSWQIGDLHLEKLRLMRHFGHFFLRGTWHQQRGWSFFIGFTRQHTPRTATAV